MTINQVRIAVIGEGSAAAAYAAIPPLAGIELVRAARDAALADPDIAGVIVATPPTGRAGNVRAAIEHGKHVLVEAPVADTLEQVDHLRQAATAASVSVIAAHPWRFHEVYRSFWARLDAGELGPPAFFHWVSEGSAGWPEDDLSDPAGPVAATAGIDLALWLLGDAPSRVYARRTGAAGETMSLHFGGGANALIEYRGPTPANCESYGFAWLLGPRGEVRWDQRADGVSVSGGTSPSPLEVRACLGQQVAATVASWRGAAGVEIADTMARRLVATIVAANESVRQGRPVAIAADAADDEGRGR